MIPTTLAVQTYEQIQRYLAKHHRQKPQVIAFFSMVDQRKTLHRNIIAQQQAGDHLFCQTVIPTRSEIEKMGQHRAPLPAFSSDSKATNEFRMLWAELKKHIDDFTSK